MLEFMIKKILNLVASNLLFNNNSSNEPINKEYYIYLFKTKIQINSERTRQKLQHPLISSKESETTSICHILEEFTRSISRYFEFLDFLIFWIWDVEKLISFPTFKYFNLPQLFVMSDIKSSLFSSVMLVLLRLKCSKFF